MDRNTQNCQDVSSFYLDLWIWCNPSQTPASNFVDFDKPILKLGVAKTQNCQDNIKRTELEGLKLPELKTSWCYTNPDTVVLVKGHIGQWSTTESQEVDPHKLNWSLMTRQKQYNEVNITLQQTVLEQLDMHAKNKPRHRLYTLLKIYLKMDHRSRQ